jgi:peptide/nickel transport system substrate-binding protein
MEAPDAHTFVLTTKVPNPSLLDILAQGWTLILPKHVMEEKGDMKKVVVGTGPFKFKEYIRGTSYEVVRNPDYFKKGRPYLDGIKTYVVPDMSAYVAAFKTHQINLLAGIPPIYKSHVEEIKAAVKGVQVHAGQMLVHNVLWMNTEQKPWDDVRVRRAVWLAVDRQAANKVLDEGEGTYGLMLAPEGKWGLPTEEILKLPGYRQPKDEDLAEAKKLMAEAGYAAGIDVVMDSRAGTTDERRATFLKDQLAKIGIRATIKLNELAKMYKIINAYTYNCVSYPNALAIDDPDDCFSRYWLPGAKWNRARLKDPKLDEMHAKQSQTVDVALRKKLVRELEDYVIAQYPAVILYWSTQYGCAWPEVRNWKIGYGIYNNLKYQDVWLAQ